MTNIEKLNAAIKKAELENDAALIEELMEERDQLEEEAAEAEAIKGDYEMAKRNFMYWGEKARNETDQDKKLRAYGMAGAYLKRSEDLKAELLAAGMTI